MFQKVLAIAYIDFLEDYITSLEIYYGYSHNLNTEDKKTKWIDLDGFRTVWLKINYNENTAPITEIDFIPCLYEKRKLVHHQSLLILENTNKLRVFSGETTKVRGRKIRSSL